LLFQELLKNAGFQVRVSDDVTAGIRTYETWRPHFIWIDWQIPDVECEETVRRIRALDGGQDVKIAAFTEFAASGRENLLSAELDDVLVKPVRAEAVFDCLARHMSLRYRYAKLKASAISELPELRPEMLMTLTADVRAELSDAVISLDARRINEVVRRIGQRDAVLGKILAHFASQYCYTPIYNALVLRRAATATIRSFDTNC
jgi:DNA-binding response OmpR family regulator